MPTVKVNGVNLYYEVAGKGFPVVLCHGYNSSHYDWALHIPWLARTYQVVVMDHRGHGLSEAPPLESKYSIPIFAQDVRALLDHLQINKCCLVGHSMGGFIALQFVVDYPQYVSALVLASTSAKLEGTSEYDKFMRRLHKIARVDGMEAAFECSALSEPITRQYLEKYPDRREAAKQKMLNTSISGYIYAWKAIARWQGVFDRLAEIAVPTKIFVGEEDNAFLEMTKELAQAITPASLCIVPNAGHSLPEERPYAFHLELTNFLLDVAQT